MNTFGHVVLLRSEAVRLTPVGAACCWCNGRVEPEDAGVFLENAVTHEECFVRMLFGSVGHQRGLCRCHGRPGLYDDPPGLTVREAAHAALREALLQFRGEVNV